MKISEFSVRNYQFTIIIFVMLMALGISSLLTMPRGEDPTFKSPTFPIIVLYPGTAPNDMEELVVDPIEEAITELDNVKTIESTIDDGLAVIRVEFVYSEDPDEKYDEVLREMNNLRGTGTLPADLLSLEVLEFTPDDVNILQAALVSETASYWQLQQQAEDLQDQLEKVRSLNNVETWAYPDRQIRIALDLEKMAQQRLPLNQVLGAVQASNVNIPGGSVDMGTKKYNIKTTQAYESLDEIRRTVVASSGQQVLYLKDIATVDFDYEDETYRGRLNGQRAVFVTASQKPGYNIFDTRDQYETVLGSFKAQLPPNIQFEKSFDQADSVGRRLSGFSRDFMIAIGLVLLTLLPLGLRASFVVMIAIPLCLAIGLSLLDFMGYSINQLSIVGLVVALGLLVDDSIVVVENIARFLREGYSRSQAAIKGTQQIGLAVVGCTAVLILAFLPLAFLPEGAGDFIRSLPVAVIATVVASLFVALTIVPFLASRFLKEGEGPEGNRVLRGLHRVIDRTYGPILHRALARPFMTLSIALALFVGSLALIPLVGTSVFPTSDKPMFLITAELPLGSNLDATDSVARFIERGLQDEPLIRNYATNVGKGNPRIYYNVVQRNEATNYSEVFVQLDAGLHVPEIKAVVDRLRERYTNYPGAKIEVKQFEQGPPVEAPVAIRVFGDNLDSLRALSFRVERLLKETPGTIYTNNPLTTLSTDVQVRVNKEKAGLLGIPVADINRTVRLGIAGIPVGTVQETEGDEFTMVATLPRTGRPRLDALEHLYVSAPTGALVPLKQLATWELTTSPTMIKHYDQERFVTLTSHVQSGYLTSDVTADVISKLDQMPFPEGYRYQAAGEVETSQDSFGGLGPIVIITIFSIIAILVLEFKTFKSTLIVLSVIPLGVIGAILALLFTGYTFSFTAVIGLIALVGIEIKNSILLVDFTNQLRVEGMELNRAIEQAGEVRFVPILLTTLTAIGGLIPLALEASPLYSPLAWVIIGGLLSSLLLTRVVTPVLYKLLPPQVAVQEASTVS